MAMPFRITLYAEDEATAKRASDAAYARVAALNHVFSDYEDDSEVSRLSRTSGQTQPVALSDDLWFVLSRAHALAERTGGAWDYTCGPLVNIWRRARRKQEVPSPELITEMRARVGWKNVRLDEKAHTAELLLPDMRLDLSSMAKGYICDEALKVLRAEGCPRALVAASGDIVAGDAPPDRPGWRVEAAALDVDGATEKPQPVVINLVNAAIGTSGDTFQRLDANGKRYSHILDVRTGQPLTDHSVVSVVAPDSLTASSHATACSVLGPVEGAKLIEATPGTAARFQRQPADKVEIVETSRWSKWLSKEIATEGR